MASVRGVMVSAVYLLTGFAALALSATQSVDSAASSCNGGDGTCPSSQTVGAAMLQVNVNPERLEPVLSISGDRVRDTTIEGKGWAHMLRPNFMKYLRCSGKSEMSCEECSGKTDCMYTPPKETFVMLNAVDPQWKRYKAVFETKCAANGMRHKAVVRVRPLAQTGKLFVKQYSVLASGKAAAPSANKKGSQRFYLDMKNEEEGPVEVQIVFDVPLTTKRPLKASFSVRVRHMNKRFASCLDNKVCLSKLWSPELGGKPTEGAKRLRSSNELQLDCLAGTLAKEDDRDGLKEACSAWNDCLPEDTKPGLEKGLVAVHLGEKKAKDDCEDFPGCVDPRTTDVEGWACSCMNSMQKACDALDGPSIKFGPQPSEDPACFTAAICGSPLVCPCWKSFACSDEDVIAIKSKLGGSFSQVDNQSGNPQKNALLERRVEAGERTSTESKALDVELDGSLGAKGCI